MSETCGSWFTDANEYSAGSSTRPVSSVSGSSRFTGGAERPSFVRLGVGIPTAGFSISNWATRTSYSGTGSLLGHSTWPVLAWIEKYTVSPRAPAATNAGSGPMAKDAAASTVAPSPLPTAPVQLVGVQPRPKSTFAEVASCGMITPSWTFEIGNAGQYRNTS